MANGQVRYCTTEDDVRIAYSVSGRGEQWLLHTNNFLTAALQFGGWPTRKRWNDALDEHYRLVRYDPRGTGLSQREVDDLTIGGLVRDLEAVADAVGAEQSVILGFLAGCYVAVWYAAAHPQRVSHLALWLPPILRADTPQSRAGAQLASEDWEAFTEYFAHAALGWTRGEEANAYAHQIRATITRETFLRGMTGWFRTWGDRPDDAFEPASRVEAPTLCMQREDFTEFPRFVAPLRHGSMRAFAGRGVVPYQDRGDEIVRAVAEFTGASQPQPIVASGQVSPRPEEGSTAIILFADIVDSTAMTERIGNAAFRERTRQLEHALRSVIRGAGGAPVQGRTLGDGVLGVFPSAAQAIEAALQCGQHADGVGLQLHLGIHAGDVIHESGNVSGIAVSMAARISDLTGPNEILVSSTVRDLARASTDVAFEDFGEHALKGVAEPQRVYAVRPRG